MIAFIFIATLAVGLNSMAIPSKPGVFTSEMRSVPSLRSKLIKEGKWDQFLAEHRKAEHSKVSGSQPLIDYYDDFYVVNVTTGTPPQIFTVLPSTSTGIYWIVGISCTSVSCNGNPEFTNYTKKHFDPSKSTTFSNQPGTRYSTQFGDYPWHNGIFYTDVFSVAPGISYATQVFGFATAVDQTIGYDPFDGILGLGWPALAKDNVIPPMQHLLSMLDKPLFTIWMDRKIPISMGGNGGLITYGAIDTTNCDSTVNYVPLSSKTYWQFAIGGFSVGNYSNTQTSQTISDTGTSWIGGPQEAVNAIASATNAQFDLNEQLYTIPCDATNLPDLVFTINGNKYNVDAYEYVIDLELGNNSCALTVFVNANPGFGPIWYLGNTFNRAYCNIFDIGGSRIGFAKAHHSSN